MTNPRSQRRRAAGKSNGPAQARIAGQCRRPRRDLLATTALQAAGLTLLAFQAAAQPAPSARPMGGQVVAGAAGIAQTAATTTVTQTSQRAAIDWRSFDIGSQHTVAYRQPNAAAITLNRVIGPDPSQIAGRIQANGQVVITNQSGVVFYKGSQVDAQSLIVSSAGISNRNFMAGRMVFDQPGRPDARISNAGTITVKETGLAALVAPQVANSGVINAKLGHVVLAGAEAHTVDLYGDGLMSLDVTREVRTRPDGGRELVTNSGVINADGGTVLLTARAADGLVTNLVGNTGTVRANQSGGRTGTVVMSAIGGSITIEGGIQADGPAAGGRGGTVQLAASGTVAVKSGARVSARGAAGGGTVAIGSAAAGAPMAAVASIEKGARISASATEAGRGGTVTVWSSRATRMEGRITARGGRAGGDGGAVEVSSHGAYSLTGSIDVSAPAGAMGTILLDPRDLNVTHGAAGSGADDGSVGPGGINAGTNPAADATITDGTINALTGNVVLQASRDLLVQNGVTVSLGGAGQTLELDAGRNLTVQAGASLSAKGALTLTAGNTVFGAGSDPAGGVAVFGAVASTGSVVQLIAGNAGGVTLTGGASGAGGVAIRAGAVAIGTAGSAGPPPVAPVAATITGPFLAITTNALVLNAISLSGTNTVAVAPISGALSVDAAKVATRLSLTPADIAALTPAGGRLNLGSAAAAPDAATTTASSVTLNAAVDLGGATLGLYAQGAIGQAAGATITAGRLVGLSGAGTSLAEANTIGQLGDLATTGNLVLANGSNPLQIAGAVAVGGGGTLNLTTGALTQTTGSSVSAALLDGSASSADLSAGTNAIASLGPFTSTGGFALKTGGALSIGGAIKDDTRVGLEAASLAINAAIGGNAGTLPAIVLTANGADGITQGAAGRLAASGLTATVQAASAPIQLTGGNAVGTASLTAQQGDVALTNASALSLSLSATAGAVSLQAPTIDLSGASAGGGVLRLTTDRLTFGGGSITAPTLAIAPLTPGQLTIDATDQTAPGRLSLRAADLSAAALPGVTHLILGSTAPSPGAALASASSITVETPVTVGAGTLSLYSSGAIGQAGGATLSVGAAGTGSLDGVAGTDLDLGAAANRIGALGGFAAGGFLVLDASGAGSGTLAVGGTVSVQPGSVLRLTAPTLALQSAALLAAGAGRVELNVDALSVQAGAAVQAAGGTVAVAPRTAALLSLDAAVAPGHLSLTQASVDALTDAAGQPAERPARLVLGNSSWDGAGAPYPDQTTASAIGFNAPLTTNGAVLGLYTTGAVTQAASAPVTAASLEGAVGTLGLATAANAIGALGNLAASGGLVALTDAAGQALTIGGHVTTAPGGTIALGAGSAHLAAAANLDPGAGGRITLLVDGLTAEAGATVGAGLAAVAVAPASAGGAMALGGGGGLVLDQAVLDALAPAAGAPARLQLGDVAASPGSATASAGSISVGGAVTIQAPILGLYAGGAVTQTGAGAITAGTLVGGAASLDLTGGDNRIATLGDFSAVGGGVALREAAGQALRVSGVVGGATGQTIRLQASSLDLQAGSGLLAYQGTVALGADTLSAAANTVYAYQGTLALAPFTAGSALSVDATTVAGHLSLTPGLLTALSSYVLPALTPARLVLGSLDGGATRAAGNISFNTALQAVPGRLSLYATGTVGQAAGAPLTAASLDGTAGAVALGGAANAIATLAGFSTDAGGFTLDGSGRATLAVAGTVATAAGSTVRLVADTLSLAAAARLAPGAGGALELQADALAVAAGATSDLPGGVVAIAPAPGGALSLGAGAGLVLTQAALDALAPAGGPARLILGSSHAGAAGIADAQAATIAVGGAITVAAPTLALYAQGAIGGAGALTAGLLVGEAQGLSLTGSNRLGAIGHLAATTGALTLQNAADLTIGASGPAAGDGQVRAAGDVSITNTGSTTLIAPEGADATVLAAAGNVTLSGTTLTLQGGLVGAGGSGGVGGSATLAATAGALTIQQGTVGASGRVSLAATGPVLIGGGLVNAPEVDIGPGPLSLSGGTLRAGRLVMSAGSATLNGVTLQTNALLDPGNAPYTGLTYQSGTLLFGGTGTLAVAVGPTLAGSISSAGGLSLSGGTVSSSADLFAAGVLSISTSGDFLQTGGTIAGGSVQVNSQGVIGQQAGGSLLSAGLLGLRAQGGGAAQIAGRLAGTTVQVIEPGAALSMAPASLNGGATLSLTTQDVAYVCPGCVSPGGFTVPLAASAVAGPYRPAGLRLDGATLDLAGDLAADQVSLHSLGATTQSAGSLITGSLTGTAGYAGSSDPLPVYVPGAGVSGGIVSLTGTGNLIAALDGYQVRGDDVTRAGLTLVDRAGTQVDSTGASQASAGLGLRGTVRAGPASGALQAGAVAAAGADVAITLQGSGATLDLGSALLAGRTVTLSVPGAITQDAAGALVAGTLTGSAGGAAEFAAATSGAAGETGNQIVGLGPFSAGGDFTLRASRDLQVTGAVSGANASITVQGGAGTPAAAEGRASGALTLGASVSGADVALTALGAISGGDAVASGTLSLLAGSVDLGVQAGTVTGAAAGPMRLTGSFGTARDLVAGGALAISDTAALTLAGASSAGGAATIAAPSLSATGTLFTGGDLRLRATGGDVVQTSGTLATAGDLFVTGASDAAPVAGGIVQGGLMAAQGSALLFAQGAATEQAGASLMAARATIIALGGDTTYGVAQAAQVTLPGASVSLAGLLPVLSGGAAGAVAGGAASQTVRLDGVNVTLDRAVVGTQSVTLHATRSIGGAGSAPVSAGLLSGSAGYGAVGTDAAGLPTYDPTVAASRLGGGVSLANAANLVTRLGPFDAAGDFSLADAASLTVAGLVRAGDSSTPLSAAEMAQSGAALSITLSGTGLSLAIGEAGQPGGTLAGRVVRLAGDGAALSETGAGAIVAAALTAGGDSVGSAALGGANQVGVLGQFTASVGSISLANQGALLVGARDAGGAVLADAGTGQVAAAGGIALTATGALTLGAASTAGAPTLLAQDGAISLGGASINLSAALVSACAAWDIGLTTAGTVGLDQGAVIGSQGSINITAGGGTTLTGGSLVNAPTVTIGGAGASILLTGGAALLAQSASLLGPVTVDGGTLHAAALATPGGLTFSGGDLFSNSDLVLATGPDLTASDSILTGGGLRLTGLLDSAGRVVAGGDLVINAPGGFAQSGGTIAGRTVTVLADGTIAQSATGAILAGDGGTLLLRARGSGAATVAGLLSGATIQVIEPGADLSLAPASFASAGASGLRGMASVSASLGTLSILCPGCANSGTGTFPVASVVTEGTFRPATLRIDAGTLSLGGVTVAADVIELHTLGVLAQAGGSRLVAGTLTGSAGYVGTLASPFALPDFSDAFGVPQVRSGGTYAVSPPLGVATVTLTNAANTIGEVAGFQVRDAAGDGLRLTVTPAAQQDSTGATVTPVALRLTGSVRGGPATDPLDAGAAQATGNDVTLRVLGAAGNLQLDGTLLGGRTVTLTADGAITEAPTGAIVAATLTGSAGTGATFDVASAPGDGTSGNQIANLGPFAVTAGDFTLRVSRDLAVGGAVAAGGTVSLMAQSGLGTPAAAEGTATGALSLAASVSGTDVALQAHGGIAGASAVASDTATLRAGGDIGLAVSAATLDAAAGGGIAVGGAFGRATARAGGALALTDSAALTLTGTSSAGAGAAIAAPAVTASGDLFAVGDVNLAVTGGTGSAGFVQTGGTIAAGAGGAGARLTIAGVDPTRPMVGGIDQQAGILAATGSALLHATTGAHQAASGAVLYAPAASVVAVDPALGAAVNDFAVTQAPGTINAPGGGIDGAGVLPVLVVGAAGSVTPGAPATSVRLDGDVLSLGRAITGTGSIVLHSTADTNATGTLTTAALSGTAGYRPDGADVAGLPTYATLDATTARGGSVSLTGAANAIATLGSYQAATALTLIDTRALAIAGTVRAGLASDPLSAPLAHGGPLLLTLTGAGAGLSLGAGSVLAGDLVALSLPGALTQAAGSLLVADRLTGTAQSVTLGERNQVASLGDFSTAGDFGLTDGRGLTVGGAVTAGAAPPATGAALRLDVAGDLAIDGGSLTAATVALTSSGALTEPDGFIVANSLQASAASIDAPSAANRIATITGLTAPGGIVLTDDPIGGLLVLAGPVVASQGPISLALTGSLRAQADIGAGGPIAITATGAAGQVAGAIAGASVALQAGGPVDLAGTVQSPGLLSVGGAGITLSGTLAGGPVVLAATAGGLTQADTGRITGQSLEASASGAASLAGTVRTDGALAVRSSGLAVSGTLGSAAGPVTLDSGAGDFALSGAATAGSGDATVTAGGAGTISGSLAAGGAVQITAGGPLGIAGAVSGQSGLIARAASLDLPGTLAGGPVVLAATAGGLTQADTGRIIGQSLEASASGPASFAGTVRTDGALAVRSTGLTVAGALGSGAGLLSLDSGAGDLGVSGRLGVDSGSAVLSAGGAAVIGGTIAAGGQVGVGAGGPVSVAGSITAPGGVTLSGQSLLLGGGLQGPAILVANGGGITQPQGGTITGPSLTANAAGSSGFEGTVTTDGAIAIGTNGLSVGGSLTSRGAGIELSGGGGALSVDGSLAAAGTVSLVAGGPVVIGGAAGAGEALRVQGGAVTVAGRLGAPSIESITRDTTSISGTLTGPVRVVVQTGDLSLTGAIVGGAVGITANGTIDQAAGAVLTGQSVATSAGGATSLAGLVQGGTVGVQATGIGVAGQVAATGGGVTLDGGTGGVAIGGVVTAPGPVLIRGDGADALLAGSTVAAGTAVTITASTSPAPAGALAGLAATVSLAGSIDTPRLLVAAQSINVQGGTLTVGGVPQPSGIVASALPTAAAGLPGAYLQAGSSLTQSGGTVIATRAPAGESTVRVDLVSGGGTVGLSGLSAPGTNLILDLGSGEVRGGPVVVRNLFVIRSGTGFAGGGAEVTGLIGNQAGSAAAGVAVIAPTPNQNYRVNGCAIGSVNCVVLRADAIPVFNPLKELTLNLFREQDETDDLLVPNVTDQGL